MSYSHRSPTLSTLGSTACVLDAATTRPRRQRPAHDRTMPDALHPFAQTPTESDVPTLPSDDFARRASLRVTNLMWFLGAGASASAGLPTATDMIWEFKQKLFVSQRRGSLQTVSDLSHPTVRDRLQAHIDSLGFPSPGAPDEYAALFEAVYPAESDRQKYLDAKLVGAKPSYGHMALATLMRAKLTRIVWTTNFDALIADACARAFGTTSALTTVALDAPELADQVIAAERWPVEIKLHGDFRSRRLKNTGDELRHQDVRLRRALSEQCCRFGLVVAGYSGRDDSVMDTLEQAIGRPGAFPAGLFWLHRGDGPPLPRVDRLLNRGAQIGVDVAFVPTQNFDESLRDTIRLLDSVDTQPLAEFAAERRPWTPASLPPARAKGWPVVRLNALPVVEAPSTCRRVVCGIGGTSEVRRAVEAARVDVMAVRSQTGVLAFGADTDVRTSFDAFGITEFDLHTLEIRRRRYESAERGLLRDALTTAIGRHRGLLASRRRRSDLLQPADPQDPLWQGLRALVGSLSGTVPDHPGLKWSEGVSTRLDWASDRLWLLIEPCTVFEEVSDRDRTAAADFARERNVARYNRALNELIGFWAQYLARDGEEMRALGVGHGVDAAYRLSSITGFSRRIIA